MPEFKNLVLSVILKKNNLYGLWLTANGARRLRRAAADAADGAKKIPGLLGGIHSYLKT